MSLRKSSSSRNWSKSDVLPKPNARRRWTPAPSRVGLALISRLMGRSDMLVSGSYGFCLALILCLHLAHFLGHHRFVLFVLFVVHGKLVEHVIRVLVFPILARIAVSQPGRLPLEKLFVSRIGQRRVDDLGRTVIAA